MMASSVTNIKLKTNYFICCCMQFLQSKKDSILYFLHRTCFCIKYGFVFHLFWAFHCVLKDEVFYSVDVYKNVYLCHMELLW